MEFKRFVLGALDTNCYLAYAGGEAMLIDPGEYSAEIAEFIKKENLKLKYIVLTHTHFDHMGGVNQFKTEFGAKLAVHADDEPGLSNDYLSFGHYLGGLDLSPADIILRDGDVIKLGECEFKVLHTPGHTVGGICLYCAPVLFSGDTIFENSIGRTDFPGGSFESLRKSAIEKIFTLPDDTAIYPGHGESTTVSREKHENMYLR